MAGTKLGAKRAQETMKKKYGEKGRIEFYRQIGAIGGRNGCGPEYMGGFAADHERARKAGAEGGKKSRRFSPYIKVFESNRDIIVKVASRRRSLKVLANKLGVPYTSLLYYVRTQVKE